MSRHRNYKQFGDAQQERNVIINILDGTVPCARVRYGVRQVTHPS